LFLFGFAGNTEAVDKHIAVGERVVTNCLPLRCLPLHSASLQNQFVHFALVNILLIKNHRRNAGKTMALQLGGVVHGTALAQRGA
jgi:hypothetical protein